MFLNYACNGFELLEVESQISFFYHDYLLILCKIFMF